MCLTVYLHGATFHQHPEYGLSTGVAISLADVAAQKERQLLKIKAEMQHLKNVFQQCRDSDVGRVV